MLRRYVGAGRILRAVVGAFTFTLGLVGCGGGGNSTAGPTTPSTPSAPTVTSVTVTAPSSSVKPGDSSQFTATAVMSNNSTQTVTNQSTWQSSAAAVATVSSTGFVATIAAGETDIRATYQSVMGSARVVVTAPTPTTFNVCGMVREAGTSITLSDATVIAKDTAFSTSTDSAGRYCLNGLSGRRYTLRATRSGYDLTEMDVNVAGNLTADISMRRLSSPAPSPAPAPTPTPSPTPTPGPNGVTCDAAAYPSSASCGKPSAVCNDDTLSCSANRSGTCSSHSGVKCWLCPGGLCTGLVGAAVSLDYTPVPLPAPAPAVTRKR
jgi:hypothetical protein